MTQQNKALELAYLESEIAYRYWIMWACYEAGGEGDGETAMHHHFHLLMELDQCEALWNSMTFNERQEYIKKMEVLYVKV